MTMEVVGFFMLAVLIKIEYHVVRIKLNLAIFNSQGNSRHLLIVNAWKANPSENNGFRNDREFKLPSNLNPKKSDPGGRLQEMITYESLDNIGLEAFLLRIW